MDYFKQFPHDLYDRRSASRQNVSFGAGESQFPSTKLNYSGNTVETSSQRQNQSNNIETTLTKKSGNVNLNVAENSKSTSKDEDSGESDRQSLFLVLRVLERTQVALFQHLENKDKELQEIRRSLDGIRKEYSSVPCGIKSDKNEAEWLGMIIQFVERSQAPFFRHIEQKNQELREATEALSKLRIERDEFRKKLDNMEEQLQKIQNILQTPVHLLNTDASTQPLQSFNYSVCVPPVPPKTCSVSHPVENQLPLYHHATVQTCPTTFANTSVAESVIPQPVSRMPTTNAGDVSASVTLAEMQEDASFKSTHGVPEQDSASFVKNRIPVMPVDLTQKSRTILKPKVGEGNTVDNLASFKPKPGSWNCDGCYLQHAADILVCPACETRKPGYEEPKNNKGTSKDTASTTGVNAFTSSSIFKFGISTPAIMSTFSFGQKPFSDFKPGLKESTGIFGNASASSQFNQSFLNSQAKPSPLNLGQFMQQSGASDISTPKLDATKTQSATWQRNERSESDAEVAQEESHENDTYFKPLLEKLPELVEKRSDEDGGEAVVFQHTAKLYRFSKTDQTWKEKGSGEMKLLKNNESGRVRCVMRRDQVLKLCCNHFITKDMKLMEMDKTRNASTWFAYEQLEDSSEHEVMHLAIRFKEEATWALFKKEFNAAVNAAGALSVSVADGPGSDTSAQHETEPNEKMVLSSRDQFVSDLEIIKVEYPEVTPEQRSRAQRLRLPEYYFAYENKHDLKEVSDSEESGQFRAANSSTKAQEKGVSDKTKELSINDSAPLPVQPISQKEPAAVPRDNNLFSFKKESKNSVEVTTTVEKPNFSFKTDREGGGLFGQSKGFPSSFGECAFDFNANVSSLPSFLSVSASTNATNGINCANVDGRNDVKWENAGAPLFSSVGSTGDRGQSGDLEEDHDPHYDPVIELPDLVERKTGEEGLTCLYKRRCKLFVYADGVWKERGVGEMKVLVPDPSTEDRSLVPRLVMRREQVLKICCNQVIAKQSPKLEEMSPKSSCWFGADYSDGTVEHVKFAIRFKTVEDMKDFRDSILSVQEGLESTTA